MVKMDVIFRRWIDAIVAKSEHLSLIEQLIRCIFEHGTVGIHFTQTMLGKGRLQLLQIEARLPLII